MGLFSKNLRRSSGLSKLKSGKGLTGFNSLTGDSIGIISGSGRTIRSPEGNCLPPVGSGGCMSGISIGLSLKPGKARPGSGRIISGSGGRKPGTVPWPNSTLGNKLTGISSIGLIGLILLRKRSKNLRLRMPSIIPEPRRGIISLGIPPITSRPSTTRSLKEPRFCFNLFNSLPKIIS